MSTPEGVIFHKGRFVAQLSLGTDPVTKKRVRRQFTAAPCDAHQETVRSCRGCQQKARDLRAAKLTELSSNTYLDPSSVTLGEWIDRYLGDHCSVRSNTLAEYRKKHEKIIRPRIGHVRLQAVDATMLEGFFRRLLRGDEIRPEPYAYSTVRQVRAIIRPALALAVKPRGSYLLYNPASEITLPRLEEGDEADDVVTLLHVWTSAQLRIFLEVAREHRDYAFFHLAAATGMRRSELAGLRWDMVDLERGTVRVERTRHIVLGEPIWAKPKSKRSRRTIGLGRAADTLREHRRAQAELRLKAGPAWDEDGTGPTLDGYSRSFGQLVTAAGLPKIRLHDLRHTHATLLLEAGRPVKEVSERLGHSSTSFTMDTYMHVTDAMRSQTADAVDAMLGL
jgi:integrase